MQEFHLLRFLLQPDNEVAFSGHQIDLYTPIILLYDTPASMWRSQALYGAFLGSLFDRVDLINVRPSVRAYVCTYVRPQKVSLISTKYKKATGLGG